MAIYSDVLLTVDFRGRKENGLPQPFGLRNDSGNRYTPQQTNC